MSPVVHGFKKSLEVTKRKEHGETAAKTTKGEAAGEDERPIDGDDDDVYEVDNYLRALHNRAALWARMGKIDKTVAPYTEVAEQEKDGLGKGSLAGQSREGTDTLGFACRKQLRNGPAGEFGTHDSVWNRRGEEDPRLKGGMEDLRNILHMLGRSEEAERISIGTAMGWKVVQSA